jgi:hypothetical protein
MPDVTALSSGFDDGYHYNFQSGYNETTALAARNATAASVDNQTAATLVVAHGPIFSNAYNWRAWLAFDMSGNDDDGSSISGNNVTSANLVLQTLSNLTGFVNYTAETDEKIILVKATASTNFDGLDKYNDMDGWVSSGTYDGNVTKYGEATQAAGGTMSFTLNSAAITDINSAISSGGTVKIGLLTEDDFLERTGTGDALGESSGNTQLGLRFKSTEDTTASNRPKLELTYGAAAAVVTTGPVKFEAGSKLQIVSGKFLIK